MAEQVLSSQPGTRSERRPELGLPLRALDHRDAIRTRDPLKRLGGLALEFATSVVPAPMALFLVALEGSPCSLAEVKVDPTLAPDPAAIERDCVAAIADGGPLPVLPGSLGQHLLMDREALERDLAFEESTFATMFMPAWGLSPIMSLILRPMGCEAICLVTLIRVEGQADFSQREKGFMRHWAPLFAQSIECVIAPETPAQTSARIPAGRSTDAAHLILTRRELEIAGHVASGASNEQIADALTITVGTVKSHIRRIYSKLGVHSRVQLSLLLSRS